MTKMVGGATVQRARAGHVAAAAPSTFSYEAIALCRS